MIVEISAASIIATAIIATIFPLYFHWLRPDKWYPDLEEENIEESEESN
ncbi:hypothetical protein H6G33_09935 [Calothrix sp. FACHB-1219]|nr:MULTISPECIES: hypothetical protein [unclassified Calothrix]MBD2201666.1 hypothetical protein [Calothrix sp. FACHB-168]MBD2217352.1 hypothetical protein [Calothrix sp. FACHB-1219]